MLTQVRPRTVACRPRTTLLATSGPVAATSINAAAVAGLSDVLGRLGEHVLLEGLPLPVVKLPAAGRAEVLDGRCGRAVPTVVVVCGGVRRSGAGATWSTALHRALYGARGTVDDFAEMRALLAVDAISVSVDDCVTDALRSAGIARCRVRLFMH